jgi:hypothetical protein
MFNQESGVELSDVKADLLKRLVEGGPRPRPFDIIWQTPRVAQGGLCFSGDLRSAPAGKVNAGVLRWLLRTCCPRTFKGLEECQIDLESIGPPVERGNGSQADSLVSGKGSRAARPNSDAPLVG